MSRSIGTRREERNLDLEEQIKQDRIAAESEAKILLLGTGGANTSSFLETLQIFQTYDYNDTERKEFKKDILTSTIQALQNILKLHHLDVKLAPFNETHRATVLGVPDTLESDAIPSEITNAMRKLCRDRGIQNVLQDQQSINVVGESSRYYLRCIERITHEEYIPSYQDLLHRYFKPGGIAEVNLRDGGLTYRIIHIGRQDGAWRKWIHCFEAVEAIAFLVRLDEYDQFIMIDGERSVNYIHDALETFDLIGNSRWFESTDIMLFLDDTRLSKKLSEHPLEEFFPDFTGGTDYDAARDYLSQRFISENKCAARRIYANFTSSTQTSLFGFVTNTVQDILLRQRIGLD